MLTKIKLFFINLWDEIKEHKCSLLFYLISMMYFLILEINNIKGWYLYVGFFMFSIGCFIWIVKYYDRIKENTYFKISFYIATLLAATFASILSDLAIYEHTGLPATDYPNTLLLITSMSSIPIFCALLAIIALIGVMIILSFKNLLEMMIIYIKPIASIFKFNIKPERTNWVKEFVLLLHFLGLFCLSVISTSYLNLLKKDNPFILNSISVLDYKYLFNYPNITHEEKVVIHGGNFYSVIRVNDKGEKYIKIMEFSKQ